MAGLGIGSWLLGPKSDRSDNPLRLYGWLELGIALGALLSPLLLMGARWIYLAMGGSESLGATGIFARMALSCIVLGIPTFLMGGTLPSAVRAVVGREEIRRSGMALLYGANALGAVAGVLVATFYAIERFGNMTSLIAAAFLNVLVACAALWVARDIPLVPGEEKKLTPGQSTKIRHWIYAASALTGFVFFLQELVWYRMLSPLLGGTAYTFGVILSAALLGVGAGALAYGLRGGQRPATPFGFGTACALQACLIALPLAMGDSLAVVAGLLQPLGLMGFAWQTAAWLGIGLFVVGLPSFVAGIQFPMLISLLGHGNAGVGADTGRAYAWNTAGAIAGSFAGGFGLVPLLSAPGAWRAAVLILTLLAAAAVIGGIRKSGHRWNRRALVPAALVIMSVLLLLPEGPSAVWRHAPTGAGRTSVARLDTTNELVKWMQHTRRGILWEEDGVETAVALSREDGLAFLVSGKSDGNARQDAPTQILCGLLPALLHDNPAEAMVVGLGTGTTAGWLGAIPGMKRVDVAEFEPVVLRVAEECRDVNQDAMNNPKVVTQIGDGREVMLAGRSRYDVISSVPSNPYRAGMAALFTREYYEAVKERLNPGGIFAQWAQGYEVDQGTFATMCRTISEVFPHIELWSTNRGDFLFIASVEPISYDADALRERMATEPFRSGIENSWRTSSLEGVFLRRVADDRAIGEFVAANAAPANTDDKTVLEFRFARTLGKRVGISTRDLGWGKGGNIPSEMVEDLDKGLLAREMMAAAAMQGELHDLPSDSPTAMLGRAKMYKMWLAKAPQPLDDAFPTDIDAANSFELAVTAWALASTGNKDALPWIARLRVIRPDEADALEAVYHASQRDGEKTLAALKLPFSQWRTLPWAHEQIVGAAMDTAVRLAEAVPSDTYREQLFDMISEPFSVAMMDERRRLALYAIASTFTEPALRDKKIVAALETSEPHVPWAESLLQTRAEVYGRTRHPLARRAADELAKYRENEAAPLEKSERKVSP